jgi:murein DD-endopeptidase MepM/ murein hydrolase activator NlpD
MNGIFHNLSSGSNKGDRSVALTDTLRLFAIAVVGGLLVGLVPFGMHNLPAAISLLGTATPTATATSTSTATPTATSTYTPTPSPTATATQTATPTPSSTPTSVPKKSTGPAQRGTATPRTARLTPTPAGTPTPTPTPVPRTVPVSSLNLPDPAQAQEHFWFGRPFENTFVTWGSSYYPFGTNGGGQYLWHQGSDIQNPMHTPILAVGDGVVERAGPDDRIKYGPRLNFFGQAVLIRHNRDWNGLPVYTLYGHVSKVLVQAGQPVKAGDRIAEVGQGGVALGPHLHLEVRVGGPDYQDALNPNLWVRPDGGYGVIAGRLIDARGYVVPQQPVLLYQVQKADQVWRMTYSYPDNVVKPDPAWGELFTFGDVPAGGYVLKVYFDGQLYTRPLTVTNQATRFVIVDARK